MLRTNLIHTSTFRLVVVYLALFVTSVIGLLGYIYWNTAGYLSRQSDGAVLDEIAELTEFYARGDVPLLVHTVIQRSRDPRQSLYLVTGPRQSVLAGNLEARPDVSVDLDGWIEFSYNRKTMDGLVIRMARAREVELPDGHYILVGRDVEQQRAIEKLITVSLIWAIALTLALGLIGGLIMSRNMLARLDAINRASREIMGGDLSRRVPYSGTGDELDQLSRNLNDMLEKIESLMKGMQEVTDNIAHDLRSPLNRLRNRLELTLMRDVSAEEYRQALEKTIMEADQLLATFNALLSIAQAEAGSQKEAMTEVDVSLLVHDAAELYEPVLEEAGMAMQVDVEAGLVLHANRELLSQAVVNLLDNAVKHAGTGKRITIKTGVDAGGRDILIDVADQGDGIPEEARARVLERFVRLEASRNKPGSGLGLSLVLAVAHLHNGEVALFDNRPGLRVLISLPRQGKLPAH